MVLDQDLNLSLDQDDINRQADIESLMPAEIVTSEWRDITGSDPDSGETFISKAWVLEWDRLDRDMTGSSGNKFLYQSTHYMPNEDRPVTSRRDLQYSKQVICFGALGLKGKHPRDFIGAKHWVRETTERRSRRPWWKSEAIYLEGQTYEEAVGKEADNLNPPAVSSNHASATLPVEEVTLDDDSPYTLFLDTINGMTHRQVITAIRKTEGLKDNEEIINGVMNGTLFDQMQEQGLLKEEDGKYFKVESE